MYFNDQKGVGVRAPEARGVSHSRSGRHTPYQDTGRSVCRARPEAADDADLRRRTQAAHGGESGIIIVMVLYKGRARRSAGATPLFSPYAAACNVLARCRTILSSLCGDTQAVSNTAWRTGASRAMAPAGCSRVTAGRGSTPSSRSLLLWGGTRYAPARYHPLVNVIYRMLTSAVDSF